MKSTMLAAILIGFCTQPVTAQATVRVVGWNMESGDSSNTHLRSQLAQKDNVDIWGLSEVSNSAALEQFEIGVEDGENADFKAILGTTAFADKLAVLFDTTRFEQVGSEIQLTDIQLGHTGLRAPLILQLRSLETGTEFLFMVNHLKRGGAQNALRLQQAQMLNDWAKQQMLPVIAVGDYNFDYHVDNGHLGVPHRDGGFDAMIADGAFVWVEPEVLVKTNHHDDFKTVLDFTFVANAPVTWNGVSTILERDGDVAATAMDFDDNSSESDHRPVDAVFMFSTGGASLKTQILQKITVIEAQLEELKVLAAGLPD